ncbi:CD3072 family TudS-related putative desulfidase [uncultured Brachyspira sp.]|uniref:CD3072 family TudS-related putative desulfidase n=1 Tax=uncultured Brachyspira sp. TaxID=221953 RepID=UPI0026095CFD|nr:CD3072 family TudS-related putative desulfidase [uncultured Brachyspira sp.]
MNRSKKLAVLSHCILNQNAVVKGEYKDMNVFFPFVQELFKNNIGILQLPCPETECYGLKRWGHVKEQFNNSGYKKYTKETLNSFVNTLKEYIDNGYEIVGIYGIAGSPSCGVNLTCSANWEGEVGLYKDKEDITSRVKMINESGIFMEMFKSILKENNINIPFYDVDDYLKK